MKGVFSCKYFHVLDNRWTQVTQHAAQHTLTILSNMHNPSVEFFANIVIGMILCSTKNFLFKSPITLSTWIRTFAIFLLVSISSGCSCWFLQTKAGINRCACCISKTSSNLKPLSARTQSFGCKILKNPHLFVI